ncbi:unnamed protein product [Periconia digitata]|uniref:Uncharacterized protein n=1 Tax=Periconia digitata TaxID=1303443 RepID=A0A9W4XI87_9PLEO|nr:unnamed protein product [Periconia digitata]
MWAQLEGFSFFTKTDYIDTWFMGDDGHGSAETIGLVGKALLTSLYILKDHGLFKPYQPTDVGGLRNLPLILALFVEFARAWNELGGEKSGGQYGETKWVHKLAQLAKENKIEIKGPYKFHKHNRKQLEPELDSEEPKKKKQKLHLSEGTWGIATSVDADLDDEADVEDDGDYSVAGWRKATSTKRHAKERRTVIGGTDYDLTRGGGRR